jgi:CheY-like chemotaxis protein
MYRVLIADDNPVRACHLEADLLDLGVKAISVVNGETAVAFCGEYNLDLVLIDLGMSDAKDALRLLGENELTAQIPVMGVSEVEDGGDWEGLCGSLDGKLQSMELAQELRNYLQREEINTESDILGFAEPETTYENPLPVLLNLSERILVQADKLKGSAAEFGPDGPEMFEFVEKSADQMHQRLIEINSGEATQQENRLRDREVRHEFRNILASVRGFTDLILMEEGIAENLVTGLKEICDCSNQFVEWLDAEKVAAFNH